MRNGAGKRDDAGGSAAGSRRCAAGAGVRPGPLRRTAGQRPAPAGGSWPITELGDYCFSEKPRSLPASDAVCRYQVDDTGAVRLTRAFGQAVGGSARRYDFDFDAPAADPDDLHPVCGSFVEEVTLRTACRSLAAVPFTTAGSCACLRWEPRA